MTGSARTRGFDGPPAEVHATTIRNPPGGSDGTRTYLLRQPHDSNSEVGRRVARGTRRWAHPRPGKNRLANGCRDPGDSSHAGWAAESRLPDSLSALRRHVELGAVRLGCSRLSALCRSIPENGIETSDGFGDDATAFSHTVQ